MAGGYKNIHGHPKHNTNGFKENPQNIVPAQNRKSFSSFVKNCEDKGIELPTKGLYIKTLTYLLSLTKDELKEIKDDENQPQWIIWMIVDLGNPKLRNKIMNDNRDYIFGKATETVEVTTKTDLSVLDLPNLSNEELIRLVDERRQKENEENNSK